MLGTLAFVNDSMPEKQASYWPRELPLCLLLLGAALFFGSDLFSPLRFDREKIQIWAFPEQTQVTGLYHYTNHSILPISFSLGIPFPVDSEHPWPAEFHVSEANANGAFLRDIETRRYQGKVVFRLWFWPAEERWIRLDYVQGAHAPRARYILQSTQKWGLPLDRGEYTLHLGEGLELASSSYPMTLNASDGAPTYSFFRSDFLPFEDWEFSWQATRSARDSAKSKP